MLNRLAALFLVLAGPGCLFLALAVPPGEVPDEVAHIVRAHSLLSGQVLGQRHPGVEAGRPVTLAGVLANPALLDVGFALPDDVIQNKHLTRDRWAALDAVRWADRRAFISVPNTAVYLPVLYSPAAAGLAASRLVGLRPARAILVARLVNVAVFLAMGATALMVARAGRAMLFVTLVLPMTVWLAGSVNPDGLLIATAALAAALLSRVGSGRRWPIALAGPCVALLGATKPCYLPLALAVLAGWRGREIRTHLWPAIGRVAAVVMPGLLWTVYASLTIAVPFSRPTYRPGPLWPGDPATVFYATDVGAQLRVLLAGPWRVVTLPAEWLRHQASDDALGAIGILGLLQILLPPWLYTAWKGAVLAAATAAPLAPGRGGGSPTRAGALLMGTGVAICVPTICLLQYLSWSDVGAASVAGVQGRYFLPLLPFAGLALSAAGSAPRPAVAALLTAAPVVVAAISAAVVPLIVLSVFYFR